MKWASVFYATMTLIIMTSGVLNASQSGTSVQSGSPRDQTRKRQLGLPNVPELEVVEPSFQSFALVIGISKYQYLPSKAQLKFADADAQALRDFLVGEKGGFEPQNVTLLVNDQATQIRIFRELDRLQRGSGPNDLVLIFFAGHGVVNSAEQGFLLAYDSRPDDLLATAVEMDRFNSILKRIRARSVVIISDACHSGTIGDLIAAGSVKNVTAKVFTESFSREDQSSFIFSAAGPTQSSLEVPALKHGLFTYYLLQGLEGEADRDHDGLVRSKELYDYVAPRVREKAKQEQYDQIPEFNPFYDRSIPLAILNEDGRKKYKDWIETDPFVSSVEASFREALSEGKLTTPEKESAWAYYNKLVEYPRQPPKLVTQMRSELLARLTTEAQAVIDRMPKDPTEWDKASTWFQKADELASDKAIQAKGFYSAAMARYYLGNLAGAEGACKAALNIIEENRLNEPFLALRIARFYKDLRKWEEARQAYKLAVENSPRVKWLTEYAEALIHVGNLAEAEAQLRRAQSLDPDDPQALKLLAHVLLQSDETEKIAEAVTFAARAREIEPGDYEIEYVYGRALLKAGEPARAVEPLRNVALRRLSDDEHRDDALLRLSQAYAQIGDVSRAVSALREAEKRGSRHPGIYEELSELLYKQGDMESAIDAAKKAANFVGNDQEKKGKILRKVGEYLERIGRLDEAVFAYRDAARLLPGAQAIPLERHANVLQQVAGPLSGRYTYSPRITVPAGREAMERLTGVTIDASNESGALAVIFDTCLRDAETHKRLISFYEQYPELAKRVMGKGGKIGEDLKLPPPKETASAAAKEAFRFFGIKDKGSRRDIDGKLFESRRYILEALGGDAQALKQGNPTSMRLRENDGLPVLFGMEQWMKILKDGAKAKPEEQLLIFLKDQQAMQLYVGLSMLPKEAAQWFFDYVVTLENLKEVAAGIYFAAPYLRFTPDPRFTTQMRLVIPGPGWERWLKAKTPVETIRELFKPENGGALYLLAALSAAGEVGDFIARSSLLFDQFYRLLQKSSLPPAREPFDLIDLFSFLHIVNDQLRLRSAAAEAWLRSLQAGGDPIAALLSKIGGASAGRQIPVVRQIAVLAQIERERPDWVSNRETIELITNQVSAHREPQLELALDLQMNPEQLAQYFRRVDQIEKISPDHRRVEKGRRGDSIRGGAPERAALPDKKLSAIRAFQSAFELLRLVARNGTLDQPKVAELTDRFLQLDPSSDRFPFDLMAIVQRDLLGAQAPASGQEVENKLVASLAAGIPLALQNRKADGQASSNPNESSQSITFYQFDSAKADQDRISRVLEWQKHTRLAAVVDALVALDALERKPSEPAHLRQLQAALEKFVEPEPPPVPKKKKSKQPAVKVPSLKELGAQLNASVDLSTLEEVRHRVAPFVGEALLGAIYAAMLNPREEKENRAAFNPDLVRNHDFSTDPWGEAQFDPARKAVRGSVARLSSVLAQLESRSPDFGGSSSSVQAPPISSLTATVLNSYQLVDRRFVTSRALEYVARTIDLGEQVLVLSTLRTPDDPAARTVINRLEDILSLRRASSTRALVDQGEIKRAINELTLSELYSLGRQYLESRLKNTPISDLINEPGPLGVLANVVRESQSDGLSPELPASLRRELRQFGMTMATRAGLVRLDLGEKLEPYERALTFREVYRLAERMQDLKLAIARTCYRQGCPAQLPLSMMLAREALQLTIAERQKATGGRLPPERDWQDIVSTIQAFDKQRLTDFITKLAESRYAQPLPEVKWDTAQVMQVSAGSKEK